MICFLMFIRFASSDALGDSQRSQQAKITISASMSFCFFVVRVFFILRFLVTFFK